MKHRAVALGLVLLLAAFASALAFRPRLSQLASSQITRAQYDIRGIGMACKVFKAEYGLYPPQSNWVAELSGDSSAVINSNRIAFFELAKREGDPPATGPRDPWGNRYVYRCPGKHKPDSCDIYSLGSDGETASDGDDPDDINNWNPKSPLEDPFHRWRFMPSATEILWFLACFFAVMIVMLLVLQLARQRVRRR